MAKAGLPARPEAFHSDAPGREALPSAPQLPESQIYGAQDGVFQLTLLAAESRSGDPPAQAQFVTALSYFTALWYRVGGSAAALSRPCMWP